MEILNSRYRELLRTERAFNDIKFFLEMRKTEQYADEPRNIRTVLDHIEFLVGVANEENN